MASSSHQLLNTSDKYVCITRPRRFGKSSIASMIGAYYSKVVKSKEIFDNLKISSSESYMENLNKYNVISISFNEIPDNMKSYDDYINMIRTQLIRDITEKYTHIKEDKYFNISSMLMDTQEKFIFIFDEWDYIFNNNMFVENQNDFLEFLRNLLKDQPYVSLCYMTGVLPIKKYSSDYFIEEMKNELSGYISDVLINTLPSTFQRLGRKSFTFEKLLQVINEQSNSKKYSEQDVRQLVLVLFESGYVGQLINSNSGKTSVVFKYRNPSAVIDYNEKMIIHRGIQKGLSIIL